MSQRNNSNDGGSVVAACGFPKYMTECFNWLNITATQVKMLLDCSYNKGCDFVNRYLDRS